MVSYILGTYVSAEHIASISIVPTTKLYGIITHETKI
jgi:hypothetical protein